MASASKIALNDTTPTLIFSGVGNVVIRPPSNAFAIGGPGVTYATGWLLSSQLSINVNSPDEIYAIADTGVTTAVAQVLEVR